MSRLRSVAAHQDELPGSHGRIGMLDAPDYPILPFGLDLVAQSPAAAGRFRRLSELIVFRVDKPAQNPPHCRVAAPAKLKIKGP